MKRVRLFSTAAAVAVFGFSLLGSGQALAAQTFSGNTCHAANLNQAFDFAWNSIRIVNNASVFRWVTCGVDNSIDAAYDEGAMESLLLFPSSFQVTAFFGDTAAPDAEVNCFVSEVPSDTETNSVANIVSTTIMADDPLPDTNGSGDLNIEGFSGFDPVTLTCRLDPGTGINSFSILLAEPFQML